MISKNAHLPGFLPYQRAWLEDISQVKIWEKSRQIGATWTQAYEDVTDCITRRCKRVFFSSADEDAGREYISYCIDWAEKLNQGFNFLSETDNDDIFDADEGASTLRLQFKNGATIHALSSNPRRFRGKSGKIVLDEFAHHNDPAGLWKAARPATTWGHSIRILSTHNSKSSLFYRFCKDVKNEKLNWSAHKTDIFDAVKFGLADKLKAKQLNQIQRASWIDEQRKLCASALIWQEEYCCEPLDESHAFLPYQAIIACEEDTIKPLAKALGDLYVGVDVGRKRDLTVIWVSEKIGHVYFSRAIIPLEKTKFADQKQKLFSILDAKNVRRCCIDATGLGMQLAEETQEAFGTYKVEPITFTARAKEELAYPVLATIEERNLRLPADNQIRDDLHSLRRVVTAAGNVRFDVDSSVETHADYFWACALSLHAGKNAGGELYIASAQHAKNKTMLNKRLNNPYTNFNLENFRGF